MNHEIKQAAIWALNLLDNKSPGKCDYEDARAQFRKAAEVCRRRIEELEESKTKGRREMTLENDEVKKFEATRNIPFVTSNGQSWFLPAGTTATVGRAGNGTLLMLVHTPSGIYRMEEKYLVFCKEIKQ